MGYYGEPVYPTATPSYGSCCSQPTFDTYTPTPVPAYGPVYTPPPRYGSGFGAALIIVVVILLIILGAVYYYQGA
ncbi:hypothetical protein BKP35_00670 [Anaerobacillus arseniciselenatis]|uniref:Sporulation protein YjcZ n=1 Tax=Anaerobacillus arseniciselenatis TaxID=85682 RepID=A0A1S2LTL9_9BACI|nr:YjcZ family sporulation protein [Anaerobacillus arseniciselenatis]OIJ15540.1 hypothetical protein BKP35_00670 [Anaerobacillus arseniciselenatis]